MGIRVMSRKKKWVIGLSLVGLILGLAYALDPNRTLAGVLGQEPFFQGRSASGWAQALNQRDDAARSQAGQSLQNGGSAAMPVLVHILRNQANGDVRTTAADAIARIGPEGMSAVGDLLDCLGDPDPFIRITAYKTLSRFAPKRGEPLPDILGEVVGRLMTHYPDIEAIRVTADYKSHASKALPKLVGLLNHEKTEVRWNAARTIGKIGEHSPAVSDAICLQLTDPEEAVREHAAEALGDLGPAAAETAPKVALLLRDPKWKVRRDAARALGNFGPAAKAHLPAIQALKADPEAEVRSAAALAERKVSPK
ncbi:MAG: HEAT repeat domain-containing protein [Fimbriiglobus sp.]